MILVALFTFVMVIHFSEDSVQARGMEFNVDYRGTDPHLVISEIVHTRERFYIDIRNAEWIDALVMANGNLVDFAVIRDGRSLVPIRNVSNELGYDVDWNAINRTVTLRKDDTTIVLPVGSRTMTVNGRAVILDVPVEIINGKTYIPLRAIGEAFGATVGYFNPMAINELARAHSIVWIDEQIQADPIPLETAIAAVRNIAPTISIYPSMYDRYELHLGDFSRYYVFAGRIEDAMTSGRSLYYVNKFTGDVFFKSGGFGFISSISLVDNIR